MFNIIKHSIDNKSPNIIKSLLYSRQTFFCFTHSFLLLISHLLYSHKMIENENFRSFPC